jgi:Tol biopolymer transport system component
MTRSLHKRLVLIGALAVTATAAAAALATTPGTNGQIAFRRWLNDETSRSALYTINPDGTGVRRIVPRLRRAHDDQPDWSPDGRLLAFSRFPDDGPAWINVVNSDGTGLRRVTPRCTRKPAPNRVPRGCEDAANVSFTPDGQHLLFTRATGRVRQFPRYEWDQIEHAAVATIATDGTDEREILRLGRYAGDVAFPQMSPDGRFILFERHNSPLRKPRMGQAIFVMNADGTNVHRVTPWKLRGGDNPDWAPDSSRIVFRSQEEADAERAQFYTVRPDGTDLTRLTNFPHGHRRVFSASFSPDGTQIVYARANDDREHGDIWLMNADGTNHRPLYAVPAADSAPDWGGLASSP